MAPNKELDLTKPVLARTTGFAGQLRRWED